MSKFFNIDAVYEDVKVEMKAELREKGLPLVHKKRFRYMVKAYVNHLLHLVVYKYQTVELWHRKGFLEGSKILCTEFNPKSQFIDINKTGGYFYFINWIKPKKYWYKVKLKPTHWWKRKMWHNVKAGADYPEIIEGRDVIFG